MLKDEFGILALGQCGSNIGTIFENRYNYTVVYVNSSQEDLDSINGTHKIKIPNADGAAKDRKKILQIASESIIEIADKITSILSHKYILCIFSSAGGTGSGLSIPLMSYLSQLDKVVIPVTVLPDETVESAKSCENAYNTCVEMMSLQNLGAAFLLDNTKLDKFAINERFVKEFDTFLTAKNSSSYGNFDNAERKQILSCPGIAMFAKESKIKSTAQDVVTALHNGIYTDIESSSAYYIGISTSNRSLDINAIVSNIGSVYDVFSGISEATTIMAVAGLAFPQKRILRFKDKFEQVVKTINIPTPSPKLDTLQALSFSRKEDPKKETVSPRDILLGLVK